MNPDITPEKEIVRGIVDNGLEGTISQETLANSAGNMSAGRFANGVNGLVRDKVLSMPSYNIGQGVTYKFNPNEARSKGYL